MRWRFSDPDNREEAAHKARVLENIEAWWEAFASDRAEIAACFKRHGKLNLPDWMHRHLHPIDTHLFWEFGPAVTQEGHRLVITPESYHHLRPMVQTLLERAPSLPAWEFYDHRLAESVEEAHATVQARVQVAYLDAETKLVRTPQNLIDVTFRSHEIASGGSDVSTNAAFVYCETLLGEEALDNWVGAIEAAPKAKGGASRDGFVPLERFFSTFEALKEAIREQLDDRPLHVLDLVNNAEWTQYKVRANEDGGEDRPGRKDIFIGNSTRYAVTQATLGQAFCSDRFSRFSETFAYLKLDRSGVKKDEWVEWRSQFEEAIDAPLQKAQAGCVYGNGTGADFSYIDLALTDVDRAVHTLRSELQRARCPKRSWLLFFDPVYSHEWVGVWDDTPPPPAREDGSVG